MPQPHQTKVSATIVAYNGYDEVAKAAASVLLYTKGVDLQLYVVDNASPDGTGARLAATDFGPRASVITLAKNLGFGAGLALLLFLHVFKRFDQFGGSLCFGFGFQTKRAVIQRLTATKPAAPLRTQQKTGRLTVIKLQKLFFSWSTS